MYLFILYKKFWKRLLCLWCRYASNLENKKIDLFDGPAEEYGEQNVLLASCKQISIYLLTCNLALYPLIIDPSADNSCSYK